MQSTILLLLALPMTLIIMTEGLDLSMGAVLTLGVDRARHPVIATGSIALGLAAALCVGLGFGLLNGWLVAVLDIPPFVATLGTLGIAQGLSLVVTDGQSVVGIPRGLQQVYGGTFVGVPVPIVIGIVAFAAIMAAALSHALRHLHLRARRQPRGAASSPACRIAPC